MSYIAEDKNRTSIWSSTTYNSSSSSIAISTFRCHTMYTSLCISTNTFIKVFIYSSYTNAPLSPQILKLISQLTIHLGFDRAKAQQTGDEIKDFVDGRYLSASEAAWRLFEYDITRRFPSVTCLPVHLKDHNFVTFEEGEIETAMGKLSVLERYFLRPKGPQFDELTYLQYHKTFQVSKTRPKTATEIWTDLSPTDKMFVYKRFHRHVTRMNNVRLQSGEVWYLRLLLRYKPARSFEDIRTVSDWYNSFPLSPLHSLNYAYNKDISALP